MQAFSTSSGGVIFIPDELERKKADKVSYADLAEQETKPKGFGATFFGRRKPTKDKLQRAA